MMTGVVVGVILAGVPATAGQPPVKPSPGAERTRNQWLKAPVDIDVKNLPLRDLLKQFAGSVEMDGKTVMWTYGPGVKAADTVSYQCRAKPLGEVLDEVLAGPGLGYVVIAEDDHPRDGWVRVVRGRARGALVTAAPPPDGPAGEDEAAATDRLKSARKLLDDGKPDQARVILRALVVKYPGTKAAAEAGKLLDEKAKP